MIFLGKENQYFKVRIYKYKPTIKYIPRFLDNVIKYMSTNEYDDFYFKNFKDAKYFIVFLLYSHMEYHERPIQRITKTLIK